MASVGVILTKVDGHWPSELRLIVNELRRQNKLVAVFLDPSSSSRLLDIELSSWSNNSGITVYFLDKLQEVWRDLLINQSIDHWIYLSGDDLVNLREIAFSFFSRLKLRSIQMPRMSLLVLRNPFPLIRPSNYKYSVRILRTAKRFLKILLILLLNVLNLNLRIILINGLVNHENILMKVFKISSTVDPLLLPPPTFELTKANLTFGSDMHESNFVVGIFGLITNRKRPIEIAQAIKDCENACLLICGYIERELLDSILLITNKVQYIESPTDQELSNYISCVDLTLLTYSDDIMASGILNFVYSFDLPFLVFDSPSYQSCLNKIGQIKNYFDGNLHSKLRELTLEFLPRKQSTNDRSRSSSLFLQDLIRSIDRP